MSTTRQIQFAVWSRGTAFSSWQARAIKQLVAHPQVQLALLIEAPAEPIAAPNGAALWRFYYRKYVLRKARAYRTEDLGELLAEVPTISYSWSEQEQQVATIREFQLDFILAFNGSGLAGSLLQAARFGIWTFQYGDHQPGTLTIPGFWEIYHGKLVTQASLQRLTDDPDKQIILHEGALKTKISHPKNIDQILFEAARWPLQACKDILYDQSDRLEADGKPANKAVFRLPTNWEMCKYAGKLVRQIAKKAFKSLFYTDFWNIGVAEVPIQRFLDSSSPPPVKWFPNLPKRKFIADPFGIKQGDRLHIVYEDFLFEEGVGTIGTLEYGQDGFSEVRIEINEPFHLSYPFTFEYEDQVYAIPESYQSGQVRLYKALDFPHKWVFDRVLIDDYAGIDNTLFFHDDRWWMFSTDKNDGVHYNLKIHFAKDLFGPWQPHPKNPVKTDIRAARPAGSIFTHEGAIFRPSMDYSEKVEGRIIINKIHLLSTTDFQEEAHNIINPFPDTFYADKVHTLCAAENFTIVDGAKELFIFNNIHAFRYQVNKQWNKLARRLKPW